jgi:hypothetical protein
VSAEILGWESLCQKAPGFTLESESASTMPNQICQM